MTDDLYCPENGLKRAQELYARAAGAGASVFLHNGSTMGIHTMLMLWAREGDKVLLPRNAHLSAVNACVLGGMEPVWMPVTQLDDGYCFVREETVLAAMDANPDAKTVMVTRPDYFGCGIRLDRIACRAHSLGMKLVADEAHGAHFPWQTAMMPAGALGADAWVQSVHKTLPGLTGSAVLHLKEEGCVPAALRIIRREQTSSPSFLLMRSIDDGRAWMDEHGRERLSSLTSKLDSLRTRLQAYGYRDPRSDWSGYGIEADPSRLVIEAPQGGHELVAALAAHGIDAEAADHRRVILLFSAMTKAEDLSALERALTMIVPGKGNIARIPDISVLPQKVLPVRRAAMADCEAVPLEKAAGRISAVPAGLYPPGVPQVMPGERITVSVTDMLQSAGTRGRFGVEDGGILCVRQ